MHRLMTKSWWILVLRGGLGILLGVVSILWIVQLGLPASDLFGLGLFLRPAVIAATLILVIGIYGFIDGLFAFTLGLQNYGEGYHWWSYSAEGVSASPWVYSLGWRRKEGLCPCSIGSPAGRSLRASWKYSRGLSSTSIGKGASLFCSGDWFPLFLVYSSWFSTSGVKRSSGSWEAMPSCLACRS